MLSPDASPMRSPLASLAGERQTSSSSGSGGKALSPSAAKKRSSTSATSFSAVDDDIDNKQSANAASSSMTGRNGLESSASSNGRDGSSNGSSSKRMKLTERGAGGPVIGQFLDGDDDDDDDDDNVECNDDNEATGVGEATSEVPAPSSVKKLKGWLSDFERKQKEHYERIPRHHNNSSNNQNANNAGASSSSLSATPSKRNQAAPTPAPTPAQNTAAAAAKARAVPHTEVVKARSTSSNNGTTSISSGVKNGTATPGRMLFGGTKPRTGIPSTTAASSNSVEATNDGYAPVSKLSAWLEDDPTSKKKGLPLAHRRGRNVSLKSRKFEPLPQNDATRTVEFRRNGVSERKQWLESAFKKDDDGKKANNGDGMSVADRAKWLQGAFAKKEDGGHTKVRRDDDGHANVAYAEVGPEEELISSGRCGGTADNIAVTATETNNETNNNSTSNEESVVSSSTCSSFSIGKQMLESRTEKNGARGVGQQKEDEEEEDPKASVQSRRAALEKKEEESRAFAESGGARRRPGGAVRAHWEVGGSGNSQSYSKTYVPEDDRRCTPAKKLSDLP